MAEESSETLDYSKKELKKIHKATEHQSRTVVTLILDENDLQRLDCVDSYTRLENLSVCKNSLLRMHGVSRMTSIRTLNLSNNAILTIEGLKELVYLRKLQLACNNIKSIEHLNNNIHLEHLDLSDNQITHISDISYLKHLKHLHLDKNRIGNLRQCERYLPSSLATLGLAGNFLTDLNTVCHLAHLSQLENFSIEGNPCVIANGQEKIEFDYRPFVINWVMNVKVVDGFEVNAIESLKAEWLYSQGRGRQFREGEHSQLIQYLEATCPLGEIALETEEQRKLRLILSKAQHHQQQLREQGPSPPRAKHSPRMHARIAGRVVNKSPDRSMSSSYHSALPAKHQTLLGLQSNQMSASFSGEIPSHLTPTKTNHNKNIAECNSVMSQSFDSSSTGLIFESERNQTDNKDATEKSVNKIDDSLKAKKELIENSEEAKLKENPKINDSYQDSNKALNQPLEAASKMVPVLDSLMSPDCQGPLFASQTGIIGGSNPHNLVANRRIVASTHAYNITSPLSISQPNNVAATHIPSGVANVNNANSSSQGLNTQAKGGKMNSNKTGSGMHIAKPTGPNVKNNKGSPQLSRSAMSSPKLRHCTEQRKGSFSSRLPQQNTEDTQSAKNLYNQSLQSSPGNTAKANKKKKQNGINKVITGLSSQAEIQVTPPDSHGANSSDEDSEMCVEKLQSIKNAANQRRQKQSISDSGSSESVLTNANKTATKTKRDLLSAYCAAVTIQKLWRGYRTRNLNQKTGKIMHSIQTMRARQYIEKLSCDMEATKAALDSERKIQQLQMQAINALWKKISAMEISCGKGDEKGENMSKGILAMENDKIDDMSNGKDLAVKELTQTCSMLQAQVQQLQGSMRDILRFVSGKHPGLAELESGGVSTQTEISAVHTPQGESSGNWPYHKTASRPCSLSLTVQNSNFKQTLSSNGTEKRESVHTETREHDTNTTTTNTDQNLPGQADKTFDKSKLNADSKEENVMAISKTCAAAPVTDGSNSDNGKFLESLKNECLGVASSIGEEKSSQLEKLES